MRALPLLALAVLLLAQGRDDALDDPEDHGHDDDGDDHVLDDVGDPLRLGGHGLPGAAGRGAERAEHAVPDGRSDERVERDDVTVFYVPASKLAEENGLKGLANIILVGKLRKELAFCTEETLDKALQKCIPARKADMFGFNRKALEIGKAQ